MITEKVEVGFDVSGSPLAPFVTLNDPVKGLLNSTEYVLGGTLYYDVTEHVINFSISRGKTRELDKYRSGRAAVTFNNETRIFDPLYDASPYAGQIIPRRPIRISVEDEIQFAGWIDDWDLSYELSGKSFASISCSDGLSLLANQTLTGGTATSELSGARIQKVLSDPLVNWPVADRVIDAGQTLLQADVIAAGVGVLPYIETITDSEPGSFFIDKTGRAAYKDRYALNTLGNTLAFSDDGTGIAYNEMTVVYGSELLYNSVVLSKLNGPTVRVDDLESQTQYGIFNLTREGLLMEEEANLTNLAILLADRYSVPEYRFEAVSVTLDKLDQDDQDAVLSLELGDVVTVKFTPNGVGSPIERAAEVIRISHSATTSRHDVTFGLGAVEGAFWKLGDPVFGRLSKGNALAY